tara:strand:+ start:14451 stop:16259 length:1809 start_codon:yes stop_codon:yes gene_type:complete
MKVLETHEDNGVFLNLPILTGPDSISPFKRGITLLLNHVAETEKVCLTCRPDLLRVEFKGTVCSDGLQYETGTMYCADCILGYVSEYQKIKDIDGGEVGAGKVFFLDNHTYEGSLLNFIPHGIGEIVFGEKCLVSKFIGSFAHGTCHGNGVLNFHNGVTFMGSFHDNCMTGFGSLVYNCGTTYHGHVKVGLREGSGKEVNDQFGVYRGHFKNDKRHGFGTHTFNSKNKDNEYYCGYWENGKRHGYGVALFDDGSSYVGFWKEGKKHGSGTFDYGDGVAFEGTWQENKAMDGSGSLKFNSKTMPHGQDIYQGRFHHGRLTGVGKRTLAEGHHFIGEFYRNLFHGEGLFRNDYHGWEFEGTFCESRPVVGTLTLQNGHRYKVRYDSKCPLIFDDPVPIFRVRIYKKRAAENCHDMSADNPIEFAQELAERADMLALELIKEEENQGKAKAAKKKKKVTRKCPEIHSEPISDQAGAGMTSPSGKVDVDDLRPTEPESRDVQPCAGGLQNMIECADPGQDHGSDSLAQDVEFDVMSLLDVCPDTFCEHVEGWMDMKYKKQTIYASHFEPKTDEIDGFISYLVHSKHMAWNLFCRPVDGPIVGDLVF